MRNGGFRISSWTGLCAGSAGIQLIGRQLKFQLSSSFNLLHNISQHWFRKYPQTTSQLLSLKQRTWFPNTKHTHVCVCVHQSFASPFMVPTLSLFVMWALLTETNAQAMHNLHFEILQDSSSLHWYIYIYIYMYSICFISEKQEGLWRVWNVTIHVNLNHVF